jgi:predicted HTH transcriptional regulator
LQKDIITSCCNHQKNYGGNDGGNDINDSILHLLKNNNQISINEIAALLNISKRKCERVIAELKRIGKVKRIGSPRKGYWAVE